MRKSILCIISFLLPLTVCGSTPGSIIARVNQWTAAHPVNWMRLSISGVGVAGSADLYNQNGSWRMASSTNGSTTFSYSTSGAGAVVYFPSANSYVETSTAIITGFSLAQLSDGIRNAATVSTSTQGSYDLVTYSFDVTKLRAANVLPTSITAYSVTYSVDNTGFVNQVVSTTNGSSTLTTVSLVSADAATVQANTPGLPDLTGAKKISGPQIRN